MSDVRMIERAGLSLRGAEPADLGWIHALVTDPDVAWHLPRPYPRSEEQVLAWYRELQERQGTSEFHFVVDDMNDRPVGVCNLFDIDWPNRSAGIALAMTESRPQGSGSQVIAMLTAWGMAEIGLHRVWATVYGDNPASLRAFAKAGFVQEGRDRQARYRHGQWVDVVRLARIEGDPEWLTSVTASSTSSITSSVS